MRHYVGVFVPSELGGWRVLFPDFPGCVAEGPNLEITIYRAADTLQQLGGLPGFETYSSPMSRNAAANRIDDAWAAAHGFSLRAAIISMIPLRGNDAQQRGRDTERDLDRRTFGSRPLEPKPAEQLHLEASLDQNREPADSSVTV